ncbi:MAG TPA: hypothetical protein VM935_12185 [Chitinophagaceae bacterium]|nr:hypothetical protein [Chitinophagaceae bacterium]
MRFKPVILSCILCLFFGGIINAQSVLYSSTVNSSINTKFEVIGKAGNFYWLYKNQKVNRPGSPHKVDNSFEVYDGRLQRVREIKSPLSDSVLKQYLIPQRFHFDQLVFKKAPNKTSVVVNRFTQDGREVVKNGHLFDFPAEMELEDLLLTRSPDRNRILLLGFVRTDNVTPDVYARLYTRDWVLLHETIYKGGNLVQPYIQYDFSGYVLESSEASPIKVTNSGDWLMVAPARLKTNFILCHFKQEDSSFVQMDVQQSKAPGIEYCHLSVEEGRNAFIGILENLTASDKRVRIMQYSLPESRLNFDTSYSFHVPNSFKKQERYLYEEAFVQIPGKGFMYMKEYGRPYFVDYLGEQVMLDNEEAYAAYSTHAGRVKFNKEEYTRKSDLSEANKRFERGDLSVKYFPFLPTDTCWSGLLHVEQTTRLRFGDLSYTYVPSGNKIIFLYNSLAKNEHKLGSSIVLDHKGQPLDEGLIFWRSANVLDFQKARVISGGEVFAPYDRNGSQGFAIIRF